VLLATSNLHLRQVIRFSAYFVNRQVSVPMSPDAPARADRQKIKAD
jgi:hypothetical protein